MADAPPPAPLPLPPPAGNLFSQLLERLLSIRTWTQTGITLVLGLSVLLGVLVYRYPQQLFELIGAALHEPPAAGVYMTPLKSDVQRQLDELLAMFGGGSALVGVMAWSVDIQTNRAMYVASAFLPDYQEQANRQIAGKWHWPLTVLSDDPARNHIIAQLYLGRFVCGATPQQWPILAAFVAQEVCLVPIPPEGFGLVGVIAGLWQQPIPIAERMHIETGFRAAAAALLWQKRAPK